MRFIVVTDVHTGLRGKRKRGEKSADYLSALFHMVNKSQETDDPVMAVVDAGDRGNRKIKNSEIRANTLLYAAALKILDSSIPYWSLNGNHDTFPDQRAEIMFAHTGRENPQDTYAVDLGPLILNCVQAETMMANEKSQGKVQLQISKAEIESYERIKRGQAKPSIDISHICLGDVYDDVMSHIRKKHSADHDCEDYMRRKHGTYENSYQNWTEIDTVRQQHGYPVVSLSGHIHEPMLMGGSISLPAFCYESPSFPASPCAAFTEIRIEDEKLSINFGSVVITGQGVCTAPLNLLAAPEIASCLQDIDINSPLIPPHPQGGV